MIITRNNTRPIKVGNVTIGGGAQISVQSMTKAPTTNIVEVLNQIETAMTAGCDIMRVSVPDDKSAVALQQIVKNSPLPIVADIHFDYRLALAAIEAGVQKLRINPGNIGSRERVKAVAEAASQKNIPIRIGVNAGSLPKDILQSFGNPTPEAMLASAEREIGILNDCSFENIVVSLKSSSPKDTLEANVQFAQKYDYPLHIGITEAGFGYQGLIASAVGLTQILSNGIGDTVRVSLAEEPVHEVRLAREILRFMDLREYGIRLICCPKCARCEADTFSITREIWEKIRDIKKPITVAVMGCVVNGPGEASHADIGVAIGKKQALIFKKGKTIGKIPLSMIVEDLTELIGEIASSANRSASSQ